jgi:DNA repair protein RadC
LAKPGSNKLHNLIGYWIASRRPDREIQFDLRPPKFPLQKLAETVLQSADAADNNWLQRTELRTPRDVTNAFVACGFHEAPGTLNAVFVDSRCGFIRAQGFGAASACEPVRTSASILRGATECHAEGIILATNDPQGQFAHGPRLRALSATLKRKGEAIDVFLLDHFLLTGKGWERWPLDHTPRGVTA